MFISTETLNVLIKEIPRIRENLKKKCDRENSYKS